MVVKDAYENNKTDNKAYSIYMIQVSFMYVNLESFSNIIDMVDLEPMK